MILLNLKNMSLNVVYFCVTVAFEESNSHTLYIYVEKHKILCYNQHMSEMEAIKCQDNKGVGESVVNRNIHVLNRKELQIRKVWFFLLMNMK